MLKIAIRNLIRQRNRTLLTLAGIVFGVAGLILTGGFVADIFARLEDGTIRSTVGHAQIYRAGYFAQSRRESTDHLFAADADMLAAIAAEAGVRVSARRLYFSGLANNGSAQLPIMGEGVEPVAEADIGSIVEAIAGRNLVAGDEYAVTLGEGLAASLQVGPGDYLSIVTNTVDGAINTLEYEVVGIFRSMSQDYDAYALRVPLSSAAALLDSESIHAVVVLLDDTALTDAVVASLGERLGVDYEVLPWYRIADFYEKTVDLYQRQFTVLVLIILLMVGMGVANSITMSLHDRTVEFGTMRALGMRQGRVFRLILVENALLGLVGGCSGVLIGWLLAVTISAVGIEMPPPPNMTSGYIASIRIVPEVLWLAFLVGFVATFLAALLPGRRASRLRIVDALRMGL